MPYIDVRKRGKLLFKFDPERDLVQIAHRGQIETVDLSEFRKDCKQETDGSISKNTAE